MLLGHDPHAPGAWLDLAQPAVRDALRSLRGRVASLSIYACESAKGVAGQAFVEELSQLLNSTVAASTTPTGHAQLGGDWLLERVAGASLLRGPVPRAPPALAERALAWRGLLQIVLSTVSWNLVGLDSNNVNVGPNQFLVGTRACNNFPFALANVVANFGWTSANPYINLKGTMTLDVATLAAGKCTDFYFNVEIKRVTVAYFTARRFVITVAANGIAPVTTPTPREVYVEKLISQNRNGVNLFTGPTNVVVGNTYTYTLDANTATGGYESLENFAFFPTTVFQVRARQVHARV